MVGLLVDNMQIVYGTSELVGGEPASLVVSGRAAIYTVVRHGGAKKGPRSLDLAGGPLPWTSARSTNPLLRLRPVVT